MLNGWMYEVGQDRDDGEPGVKLWSLGQNLPGIGFLIQDRGKLCRLDDDLGLHRVGDEAGVVGLLVELREFLRRRRFLPPNRTWGRRVTFVMASLPAASFPRTPTAWSR